MKHLFSSKPLLPLAFATALGLGSAALVHAAPVDLIDPSFESEAANTQFPDTYGGQDSGWWRDPFRYPGGNNGMLYVNDASSGDGGAQAALLGFPSELRSLQQTLSTTYEAATDYTLTVYARAVTYGSFADNETAELTLVLFDGVTTTVIKEETFTVTKNITGSAGDKTFTVTATDIAATGSVGRPIGIRLEKSALGPALGSSPDGRIELRVDNVRLETSPADAYQVILETSDDLATWTPLESRGATADEGELAYRLRIEELTSVDLVNSGFETGASGDPFPTADQGIDGGWWRDTILYPGGNGGMLYVNDAAAGDGGSRVALLGFPPELRALQQSVGTTFEAGVDYTLTVFGRAISYGGFADNTDVEMTLTLFSHDTGAAIKEDAFVVVKGSDGDRSITATAAEIDAAGAVGQNIGIRVAKSQLFDPVGASTDGRIELRIDKVRLTNTPVPGVLGLRTETSPDGRDWSPAGLRRITPDAAREFYRLEIEPLAAP